MFTYKVTIPINKENYDTESFYFQGNNSPTKDRVIETIEKIINICERQDYEYWQHVLEIIMDCKDWPELPDHCIQRYGFVSIMNLSICIERITILDC